MVLSHKEVLSGLGGVGARGSTCSPLRPRGLGAGGLTQGSSCQGPREWTGLCTHTSDQCVLPVPQEMIPFAVVGSDHEYQVNGKRILGRKTKWGTIEGNS